MKYIVKIVVVLIAGVAMVSCAEKGKPNYQYMPNMYEPVGYETYGNYEVFPGQMEAMLPAEGSIPRGWQPYEYDNTNEGRDLAKAELKNPLPVTQANLDNGKKMYDIYCALCHGGQGAGQGILVKNEKILGIPSYADPGRVINDGGIYHVQMYGLNSMGSYASQTNEEERWQITMHVMNLKAALEGTPALEIVPEPEIAEGHHEEESGAEDHGNEDHDTQEDH